MTTRRVSISLGLDILLFAMVFASALWMFLSGGRALAVSGIGFLKFFTVESNLFVGLAAVIAIPFEILLLSEKRIQNPLALRVIYFTAACSTSVTMLTVFLFLGPTMGFSFMFQGPNLFMHLLTPIAALVRIVFFENSEEKTPWIFGLFGALPVLIYGIVYLTNIALNNGYGNPDYDWYGFAKEGIFLGFLAFAIMIAATTGVSYGILALQRLNGPRSK